MKQNKKTINEAQLRNMIVESVKKMLREGYKPNQLKTIVGEDMSVLENALDSLESKLLAVSARPGSVEGFDASAKGLCGDMQIKSALKCFGDVHKAFHNLKICLEVY